MINELTPEQLFYWAGQASFYGWVILIFLPRIKVLFCLPQYLIPFGISLLYAGLILVHYFGSAGGFGTLQKVRVLFENDYLLLAGWIHYLAFDLFIGAWIAKKADLLSLSRFIQGPILLATYIFGPLGLALFLIINAMHSNQSNSIKEGRNNVIHST